MKSKNNEALTESPPDTWPYRQSAECRKLFPGDDERLRTREFSCDEAGAAWPMIYSHVRDVAEIAKEFSEFGLPGEELIRTGTVGLIKAMNRFDPSGRARISQVATASIRAEILAFVLQKDQSGNALKKFARDEDLLCDAIFMNTVIA